MHPVINIEIGQHSFNSSVITPENCQAIIKDILQALGIEADLNIGFSNHPVFCSVNGLPCDFPPTLPQLVADYTVLHETATGKTSYWGLFIGQLLQLQPALLLPAGIAGAYFTAIEKSGAAPGQTINEGCMEILGELLQLKISLVNKAVIDTIGNKYLLHENIEWNMLREELVLTLSAPHVNIYCNQHYFNTLIKANTTENIFEQMINSLQNETGVVYPDFNMIFDDSLPFEVFRFGVNDYLSLPQTGLNSAEMFVNAGPPELKELAGARAVINPVDGYTCSVISTADAEKALQWGYSTWNAPEYFLLCLNMFLRQHTCCFINNNQLPAVRESIREKYPELYNFFAAGTLSAVLVKLLRLLAQEEMSIRHASIIMESMLESDYITAGNREAIIVDERVQMPVGTGPHWKERAENLLPFVRMRLKRFIAFKYFTVQPSLLVYRLDPEIEYLSDPVRRGLPTPTAEIVLKIRAAVEKQIGGLPPSAQSTVILTTANARAQIKKIIEIRFPQVAVLSYQELPLQVTTEVLAVIELERPAADNLLN